MAVPTRTDAPARRRTPGRERVPAGIAVLATLGALFFVIPLAGLLWRAPWSAVWTTLSSHDARTALRLSLVTSLASTGIAILLGVPLAWVQARVAYPGRRVVRAVTILPMVLPPVVGGIALLLAFGRRGLVGEPLDRVGVHLPFHVLGAIAAETFVAMPFLVLTVEAAFRAADRRYEDAARTLGASRLSVFRRITLPTIRPALIAGAVLCWARALGEFGATITFAGNAAGKTQTLPLFVYIKLEEGSTDAAIMLSLVLLAVSLVVLVSLRDRWLSVL
jgi:molybdate transport system permease protein